MWNMSFLKDCCFRTVSVDIYREPPVIADYTGGFRTVSVDIYQGKIAGRKT